MHALLLLGHLKQASEYREHAAECRRLAALVPLDQRNQLLQMALTWERLADERQSRASAATSLTGSVAVGMNAPAPSRGR